MYKYLIVKYTVQLLLVRVTMRMIEDSLQRQIDDIRSGRVECFDAIYRHLQEFMRLRRIFNRFNVMSAIGHYFGRF